MEFEKKSGLLSSKYLSDGCEFKKIKNEYKLVSTNGNEKYAPFKNECYSESCWDIISNSDITHGPKHTEFLNYLINELKKGKALIYKQPDIILKKGEQILFYPKVLNITLSEPRSVRVTNSTGGGASYRVNKNIRVGGGKSRSVSKSHDVVTAIDSGKFIITNKRLIFTGNKKNINVNLSKIISITTYKDGIILQRQNKQKAEYFTGFGRFMGYRKFNDEKYYYTLNGEIVKAAIQGAINPVKDTNKQITKQNNKPKEIKPITATFDEISFSYNEDWIEIEDENELITIAKKINDNVGLIKFHKGPKNNVPRDKIEEFLINKIESDGATVKNSKIEKINNIQMIFVEWADKRANSIVTYFEGSEKGYLFSHISSKEIDITEEYINLLKSVKIKENDQNKENNSSRAIDDLMKYAELYEKGLLTKEEFETKKKELL